MLIGDHTDCRQISVSEIYLEERQTVLGTYTGTLVSGLLPNKEVIIDELTAYFVAMLD